VEINRPAGHRLEARSASLSSRLASLGGNELRGWLRKSPSGVCMHLQLKDKFKKSLPMSGQVGSLAGDQVISHERSQPFDSQ
jgi:hypothetical protein